MKENNNFNILALVDIATADLVRAAVESVGGCSLVVDGGESAIQTVQNGDIVDLVLLDPNAVSMATADGIAFLKAACPTCEIALLLGDHDITMDVELMRMGAYDSLPSPPSKAELVLLISGLMEKNEMERENRAMVEALGQGRAQTIISHSPEMEKVLSMAARAAKSDSTVLITGESGTGKELVARAIHLAGPRKHKAFVPVNIAALQENLIESELFGHVKGAFTGAMADRTGRFALADGGTLFIDEIGEVPSGIQVKLLRVLQFGSFERVGENAPHESDVRIIAATNRDLEAEVRAGRFRADLYYRVNVVPVSLPALRDHRGDIPYLVEYFIKKYSSKNRKPVKGITAEAMSRIMRYPFPGNVRELENVLERGVVLCRGEYLTETDIFLPTDDPREDNSMPTLSGGYDEVMGGFEKEFLSRVLERNAHNKSAAARELGINERRLRYRLKVLSLE
ncbi:MAG: two-component system response regulator [Spirochaetae bacterium HGW-Spirochaetae-7]|jgi:DNA-binding NtrC family response regulator|nr:MAG: two-component system response regulator [Spirochaetae bacterium HGW-Spirochaetae-7]